MSPEGGDAPAQLAAEAVARRSYGKFHATLLLYSVIHQNMPLKLYAIHAGHGLANEFVITAILGAWRLKAGPAMSSSSFI